MFEALAPLFSIVASYWWLVVLAVAVPALRLPTVKGHLGEWIVRRRLKRTLPADRYVCRHDVTLPCSDGNTTQIDHVVVSRFGVFVIETKNMSGWIFGSPRDATWTQRHFRHTTRFQNPLRQNHRHVMTLAETLGIDQALMHPVVAFVGGAEFKTPMPANITDGQGLVRYLTSHEREMISPEAMRTLLAKLDDAALAATSATRRQHVANLRARSRDRADESKCPRCAGPLVRRVPRRAGGRRFLGCASYPRCRGTRPLPGS